MGHVICRWVSWSQFSIIFPLLLRKLSRFDDIYGAAQILYCFVSLIFVVVEWCPRTANTTYFIRLKLKQSALNKSSTTRKTFKMMMFHFLAFLVCKNELLFGKIKFNRLSNTDTRWERNTSHEFLKNLQEYFTRNIILLTDFHLSLSNYLLLQHERMESHGASREIACLNLFILY